MYERKFSRTADFVKHRAPEGNIKWARVEGTLDTWIKPKWVWVLWDRNWSKIAKGREEKLCLKLLRSGPSFHWAPDSDTVSFFNMWRILWRWYKTRGVNYPWTHRCVQWWGEIPSKVTAGTGVNTLRGYSFTQTPGKREKPH